MASTTTTDEVPLDRRIYVPASRGRFVATGHEVLELVRQAVWESSIVRSILNPPTDVMGHALQTSSDKRRKNKRKLSKHALLQLFKEMLRHDKTTSQLQHLGKRKYLKRTDFFPALNSVLKVTIPWAERDLLFAQIDLNENGVIDFEPDFLQTFSNRSGGSASSRSLLSHSNKYSILSRSKSPVKRTKQEIFDIRAGATGPGNGSKGNIQLNTGQRRLTHKLWKLCGMLSRRELTLRQIFGHRHSVSLAEFVRAFSHLKITFTHSEIYDLMRAMDHDLDRRLAFTDFAAYFKVLYSHYNKRHGSSENSPQKIDSAIGSPVSPIGSQLGPQRKRSIWDGKNDSKTTSQSIEEAPPENLPGPFTALLQSSFIGRRRNSEQHRIIQRSALLTSPTRPEHDNKGNNNNNKNNNSPHSSIQLLPRKTKESNDQYSTIATKRTRKKRIPKCSREPFRTPSPGVWKGPLFGRISSDVTVFVVDCSEAMTTSPMSVTGIETSRFGFALAEIQLVMQRQLLPHVQANVEGNVGASVKVNVAVVDVDGAIVMWHSRPQRVSQQLVDQFVEFIEHVYRQMKRRSDGEKKNNNNNNKNNEKSVNPHDKNRQQPECRRQQEEEGEQEEEQEQEEEEEEEKQRQEKKRKVNEAVAGGISVDVLSAAIDTVVGIDHSNNNKSNNNNNNNNDKGSQNNAWSVDAVYVVVASDRPTRIQITTTETGTRELCGDGLLLGTLEVQDILATEKVISDKTHSNWEERSDNFKKKKKKKKKNNKKNKKKNSNKTTKSVGSRWNCPVTVSVVGCKPDHVCRNGPASRLALSSGGKHRWVDDTGDHFVITSDWAPLAKEWVAYCASNKAALGCQASTNPDSNQQEQQQHMQTQNSITSWRDFLASRAPTELVQHHQQPMDNTKKYIGKDTLPTTTTPLRINNLQFNNSNNSSSNNSNKNNIKVPDETDVRWQQATLRLLCRSFAELKVHWDGVFDAFDGNRDGQVSMHEFLIVVRQVLRSAHPHYHIVPPTRRQEAMLWECISPQGDSALSRERFVSAFKRTSKALLRRAEHENGAKEEEEEQQEQEREEWKDHNAYDTDDDDDDDDADDVEADVMLNAGGAYSVSTPRLKMTTRLNQTTVPSNQVWCPAERSAGTAEALANGLSADVTELQNPNVLRSLSGMPATDTSVWQAFCSAVLETRKKSNDSICNLNPNPNGSIGNPNGSISNPIEGRRRFGAKAASDVNETWSCTRVGAVREAVNFYSSGSNHKNARTHFQEEEQTRNSFEDLGLVLDEKGETSLRALAVESMNHKMPCPSYATFHVNDLTHWLSQNDCEELQATCVPAINQSACADLHMLHSNENGVDGGGVLVSPALRNRARASLLIGRIVVRKGLRYVVCGMRQQPCDTNTAHAPNTWMTKPIGGQYQISPSTVSICLSPVGEISSSSTAEEFTSSDVLWVPLRFKSVTAGQQHKHMKQQPTLLVELNAGEIQSDGSSIVTGPSCVPVESFTRGLAIHAASSIKVELDWSGSFGHVYNDHIHGSSGYVYKDGFEYLNKRNISRSFGDVNSCVKAHSDVTHKNNNNNNNNSTAIASVFGNTVTVHASSTVSICTVRVEASLTNSVALMECTVIQGQDAVDKRSCEIWFCRNISNVKKESEQTTSQHSDEHASSDAKQNATQHTNTSTKTKSDLNQNLFANQHTNKHSDDSCSSPITNTQSLLEIAESLVANSENKQSIQECVLPAYMFDSGFVPCVAYPGMWTRDILKVDEAGMQLRCYTSGSWPIKLKTGEEEEEGQQEEQQQQQHRGEEVEGAESYLREKKENHNEEEAAEEEIEQQQQQQQQQQQHTRDSDGESLLSSENNSLVEEDTENESNILLSSRNSNRQLMDINTNDHETNSSPEIVFVRVGEHIVACFKTAHSSSATIDYVQNNNDDNDSNNNNNNVPCECTTSVPMFNSSKQSRKTRSGGMLHLPCATALSLTAFWLDLVKANKTSWITNTFVKGHVSVAELLRMAQELQTGLSRSELFLILSILDRGNTRRIKAIDLTAVFLAVAENVVSDLNILKRKKRFGTMLENNKPNQNNKNKEVTRLHSPTLDDLGVPSHDFEQEMNFNVDSPEQNLYCKQLKLHEKHVKHMRTQISRQTDKRRAEYWALHAKCDGVKLTLRKLETSDDELKAQQQQQHVQQRRVMNERVGVCTARELVAKRNKLRGLILQESERLKECEREKERRWPVKETRRQVGSFTDITGVACTAVDPNVNLAALCCPWQHTSMGMSAGCAEDQACTLRMSMIRVHVNK